jgi:hypothetical protein
MLETHSNRSCLALKGGRDTARLHGGRTRLWTTAETAVKRADHNPGLIGQTTRALEHELRREGMLD